MPDFTWSAWESAFTRPDGEPEGVPTSISECTLDGKPVGSVMRFGTGRYTAFFPDQSHHSHIETEARAKGLVEHAAGGSVAPLDPRQIVNQLRDAPRAATEEEVRNLVEALADERERFGALWQMRQRSLATLTLANARIARLEIELAAANLAITHPHGEVGVGDQVEKCLGYKWPGEVRSVFTNRAGEIRFVVECTAEAVNGALHIFNGNQIRRARAALKGDA